MQHALTYSIIEHISNQLPEVGGRVVWIFDGVTLTGRGKPFITVRPMISGNTRMSVRGGSYNEIYTWQIGVFGRSDGEMSRLCETTRTVLRQLNIPFIDTRGAVPVESGDTFVIDVGTTTRIPRDEIYEDTNEHRSYIDIEVSLYRSNADGLNFSQ